MSSSNSSILDYTVKPVISGSAAYLISKVLYPHGTFGKYSLAAVTAATVTVGSLASELVFDAMFGSTIDRNNRYQVLAEAVAIGTNFGTSVAVIGYLDAPSLKTIGYTDLLIEAAAAEIIGQYVYGLMKPFLV